MRDAPDIGGTPVQTPARTPEELGEVNQNPPGIGFWALVREDYEVHWRDPMSQGFWALFWHRFGNLRMSIRPRPLRLPFTAVYKVMFKLTQMLCGVELPYTVPVGRRVHIEHFGGIVISARGIGDEVTLRQNTTLGVARTDDLRARPLIGARVDIGAGAAILGAVTIGDDAVIGANAVVLRDVPPGHVAVGVPARIRPRRRPDAAPGVSAMPEAGALRRTDAPGRAGGRSP
jgi:serine O-acetyltransferase